MLWNPLLPYMHRKRREIPYTVCHVPADAALSFTALAIITIKTHSKLTNTSKSKKRRFGKNEKDSLRQ
jgi:hypothetical protein